MLAQGEDAEAVALEATGAAIYALPPDQAEAPAPAPAALSLAEQLAESLPEPTLDAGEMADLWDSI